MSETNPLQPNLDPQDLAKSNTELVQVLKDSGQLPVSSQNRAQEFMDTNRQEGLEKATKLRDSVRAQLSSTLEDLSFQAINRSIKEKRAAQEISKGDSGMTVLERRIEAGELMVLLAQFTKQPTSVSEIREQAGNISLFLKDVAEYVDSRKRDMRNLDVAMNPEITPIDSIALRSQLEGLNLENHNPDGNMARFIELDLEYTGEMEQVTLIDDTIEGLLKLASPNINTGQYTYGPRSAQSAMQAVHAMRAVQKAMLFDLRWKAQEKK
jgi:hypothetical protein